MITGGENLINSLKFAKAAGSVNVQLLLVFASLFRCPMR